MFVENKEHERALETPVESEQISEKAGNKVDDITVINTDCLSGKAFVSN